MRREPAVSDSLTTTLLTSPATADVPAAENSCCTRVSNGARSRPRGPHSLGVHLGGRHVGQRRQISRHSVGIDLQTTEFTATRTVGRGEGVGSAAGVRASACSGGRRTSRASGRRIVTVAESLWLPPVYYCPRLQCVVRYHPVSSRAGLPPRGSHLVVAAIGGAFG